MDLSWHQAGGPQKIYKRSPRRTRTSDISLFQNHCTVNRVFHGQYHERERNFGFCRAEPAEKGLVLGGYIYIIEAQLSHVAS